MKLSSGIREECGLHPGLPVCEREDLRTGKGSRMQPIKLPDYGIFPKLGGEYSSESRRIA